MFDFRGTGKGDNQRISKEVGVPLCEALVAYDSGDFAKAVSLVNPIRYKILTIGGSHAQVKLEAFSVTLMIYPNLYFVYRQLGI